MKFIDSISIQVRAGRGGDGIVSFKSSKGKPRLGPDGGDGGRGGDVVAIADPGINTLSSLRYKAIYKAEDGARGGANGCRGRCGEDFLLKLPVGTVIKDAKTGRILGELLTKDQTMIVAKGGRHGLGNTHWASSTHQTPEEFRPGAPGEELELELDLKLLADIGLAGFPNAGKSTLLSRISAARPKIADYPFTTLVPNLGVVEVTRDEFYRDAYVVADVPGLIEGASEGRGLGLQFLKHLERTSVIAYVIDAFDWERTPVEALEILKAELAQFSPVMARKQAMIVLSKADLCDEEHLSLVLEALRPSGLEVLCVSGVSGEGLTSLMRRWNELVRDAKASLDQDSSLEISSDPLLGDTLESDPQVIDPLAAPWDQDDQKGWSKVPVHSTNRPKIPIAAPINS